MTQARPTHLRLVTTEPAPPAAREPRLRFRSVVCLADGAPYGLNAETDISYEECYRARGPVANDVQSAAEWLGDLIERVARHASESDHQARPIAINAPISILNDRDAPMAAEAGARRANVLPQEIRIDFEDTAVSSLEDIALDRIDAFRTRGFRVGLDARTSWRTPMSSRARITFEAVRIDPNNLPSMDIPLSRLEVAAAEGVALIAENVRWRDAEDLAEVGVLFASAPRTDS